MKKIVQIFIILLFSQRALADCAGDGIYYWPQNQTLFQNSIIMIEGYGLSQDIIKDFNKKYPVYLGTKGHKVKLEVVETLVGGFHLTQAILKPTENLLAGNDYYIIIENLPHKESEMQRWNPQSKAYELVKWSVIEGTDTTPPKFIKNPVEISKNVEYFGCGPDRHVTFGFEVEEKSEFLIKAIVTDIESKATRTYYLNTKDAKVLIGHGMCSGAFDLKEDHGYEIQFGLMDASYNTSSTLTDKIKFKAP